VQVAIENANVNVVATDASNVTLSIGTNSGGGTLSGTVTVAAVNGIATFRNLSINKAGTGYTLVASNGSPTGATSSPFNVTGQYLVNILGGNTITAGNSFNVFVQATNGSSYNGPTTV